MLRILKTEENEFIIKTEKTAIFCSTQGKLITVMHQIGISFDEIEFGLSDMIKNDNNIAEYGSGLIEGAGPAFLFSDKIKKAS